MDCPQREWAKSPHTSWVPQVLRIWGPRKATPGPKKKAVMIRAIVITALFAAPLGPPAQIVPAHPPARSPVSSDSVAYLFPTQVDVPAGKPAQVSLHFRIAHGMHINSHTPLSEFLIPTAFSLEDSSGVRLAAATYPTGSEITLPADPTTKLNVYTGDFVIQARFIADAGDHPIQAKLHYQACNENECLPPKTITVPIDVVGK